MMKIKQKPLIRWTVGPCISQGIDILETSVRSMVSLYGDKFDYVICYNNLNKDYLSKLNSLAEEIHVNLLEQDCNFLYHTNSIQDKDGSFPINGDKCIGSTWKFSPDRLRFSSHEIFIDNDLVIQSKLNEIDDFLSSDDKAFVLCDRYKYYGNYESDLLKTAPKYFNTGLVGLPPNYNICNLFREICKDAEITQADEQGIVASMLYRDFGHNLLIISDIGQILAGSSECSYSYSGTNIDVEAVLFESIKHKVKGFHFCQANKIDKHIGWELYKRWIAVCVKS